jgi:hypothetical protein
VQIDWLLRIDWLQRVNIQVDCVVNVLFEQIDTCHFVDVLDDLGLIRRVAQLSNRREFNSISCLFSFEFIIRLLVRCEPRTFWRRLCKVWPRRLTENAHRSLHWLIWPKSLTQS